MRDPWRGPGGGKGDAQGKGWACGRGSGPGGGAHLRVPIHELLPGRQRRAKHGLQEDRQLQVDDAEELEKRARAVGVEVGLEKIVHLLGV